jgi:succinate dehydrogenase flavin-adding protein (antitoxin of CptAB toxin-antitoxin module)
MMNNSENRLRRLIYRSINRGCKETDYIFSDFALNELQNLSVSELDDYEKLLEVDDATLYSWFAGIDKVDSVYNTPVFHKLQVYNERRF